MSGDYSYWGMSQLPVDNRSQLEKEIAARRKQTEGMSLQDIETQYSTGHRPIQNPMAYDVGNWMQDTSPTFLGGLGKLASKLGMGDSIMPGDVGMAAWDASNFFPGKGATVAAAGTIFDVARGFEKGTWHKAFQNPRELGAHHSIGKRVGEHFQGLYRDKGDIRSYKIDLNPLETVDTNGTWNAYTTLRALKQKGLDKLSTKGQVKLNRIANDYIKAKQGVLNAASEEALTEQYNKKFVSVLRDEGYDSIHYPAVEGEIVGLPKDEWGALIIFDDPLKAPINPRKLDKDLVQIDHTWEKALEGQEWQGKKAATVYVDPDVYINKAAAAFKRVEDKMDASTRELAGLGKEKRSLEVIKQEMIENRAELTNKYKLAMKKGDVFPMGMLDFGENGYFAQEGLHRALAAKEAGYSKIPVLIRGTTSRKARRPRTKEEHAEYLAKKQPVDDTIINKPDSFHKGFIKHQRKALKRIDDLLQGETNPNVVEELHWMKKMIQEEKQIPDIDTHIGMARTRRIKDKPLPELQDRTIMVQRNRFDPASKNRHQSQVPYELTGEVIKKGDNLVVRAKNLENGNMVNLYLGGAEEPLSKVKLNGMPLTKSNIEALLKRRNIKTVK